MNDSCYDAHVNRTQLLIVLLSVDTVSLILIDRMTCSHDEDFIAHSCSFTFTYTLRSDDK